MIDIKELSIGNWVLYQNQPCEIIRIELNDRVRLQGFKKDTSSTLLFPIEITESLLRNIGFDFKQENLIKIYSYGFFKFAITDTNDLEMIAVQGDYEFNFNKTHILNRSISLHKIQNLYFIITDSFINIEKEMLQ